MSETDIEKGAVWSKEIAQRLGACRAGVSFVTHENRNAPWLNFEAGAMLKLAGNSSHMCTLLLDGLTPSDVAGPLSIFHHTQPTEEEILKLVLNLASFVEAGADREAIGARLRPCGLSLMRLLDKLRGPDESESDGPIARFSTSCWRRCVQFNGS
jgi:hypothetical protein